MYFDRLPNVSRGMQAAGQRVKWGTRPWCCGVAAELTLLLAAPWAAPCPLWGAVPRSSTVPGAARRVVTWCGAFAGQWHGKLGVMGHVALTYSSSLFSLLSSLWSETFYIFYSTSFCSISQSFFLYWVISSGSFFLFIFSQHFWSRKYIKDASSLSWTLKPTASEGLQGWGGLAFLLSEEDGVGLACPSPPRTGVKQEQSGGECSSEQKWHQDLPPTRGHHCPAFWWEHIF